MKGICFVAVAALALSAAVAAADPGTAALANLTATEHATLAPDSMHWNDGPPWLPRGAKIAVLEGDPSQPRPFTIRMRVPDGYRVAPHWHPATEHVTVISGTFHVAMGDAFDDSRGTALPPGAFAYMGPEMHHFAWFTGETEIQIHGIGPFGITYVHSQDDPRNNGKGSAVSRHD